ncbi:hypothetical protein ROJ8625_03253 [Roseivivax jejudonensis]|uniref:DUF1127 domain-containing protein n=1 Tax=Roseivivax jejudonensis TaxID=1529041 RepID=A0A1X6ZX46_9RHOB|nr:hypothetical protein [Roseivivax jejudonensis]SLN64178.1 hypothetical protein ROJ8625_03253 [Roseivivax jejudonensis]
MTISTFDAGTSQTRSLSDIVSAIAPRKFKFDPLGLVSGYRSYTIYTRLAAKSDAELAELGIARTDLPRVAMEAVFQNRDA